ncbi:hypothetical protein D3C85_1183860 [compost metagenome]
MLQQGRLESEGNKRGPRLRHPQAELARHLIAPAGRAHLGDGLAAGGHHQRGGRNAGSVVQGDLETVPAAADGGHAQAQRQGHARRLHLVRQHTDDLLGAVVTEQLAQGLLVPGDAVALDHFQEVVLGEPLQRRQGEARVLAQEVRPAGPQIGEVAASAARDADLLARCAGVVDDAHAAAALARLDGAHHAGRAGADDQDVEI